MRFTLSNHQYSGAPDDFLTNLNRLKPLLEQWMCEGRHMDARDKCFEYEVASEDRKKWPFPTMLHKIDYQATVKQWRREIEDHIKAVRESQVET